MLPEPTAYVALALTADFDVQDERPYMVMELLEGDTLCARLNQCRLLRIQGLLEQLNIVRS